MPPVPDAAPHAASDLLGAALAARVAETADALERRTRHRGLRTHWLTARIPLPRLLDPNADVVVLRYDRYTVVVDRARRLARLSAAGLAGRNDPHLVWLTRAGDDAEPVALAAAAAAGAASYHLDPRLPPGGQVGADWYAGANRLLAAARPLLDFDKGHLTAQAQVAYGRTRAQAATSQSDSFSYANLAPQLNDFNRTRSDWVQVERWVRGVSDLGLRAVQFTGAVLAADDPVLEIDGDAVAVPRAFWKVIAVERLAPDPERTVFAFVLDDTAAVESAVADANRVARIVRETGRLPAVAAGLPIAPPQDVRRTTVAAVAALAGVAFAGLAGFDEPPLPAAPRIRSLGDVVRATQLGH